MTNDEVVECLEDIQQCLYFVEDVTPELFDRLGAVIDRLKETTRHVRHYSRPNVYADLWLHCEKCGGKIDDRFHFKYCPECGRKVEWPDDSVV